VDKQRNLVITGFMGVGKTAVGKAVAGRLGRPFVDMDAQIESQTGKTIRELFDQDGEAAFRRHEAKLCQELSGRKNLVIATGGGALVPLENLEAMQQTGIVICLTCAIDEMVERLRGDAARPLLGDGDPRARIEALLDVRRQAYDGMPWRINTTGKTVNEVADLVARLAGSRRLTVRHPHATYPIHIGAGLFSHLGDAIGAAGIDAAARLCVVSNTVVCPLYGDAVLEVLRRAGFDAGMCVLPDGERHKTLDTVRGVYDALLSQGLDRGGVVLSLGGGVTGDIAGYAAATYLRGIRFVQIPTSLLAMVDASVGGKTGVDLPEGKNLVGAFKQPELVVIDPLVLTTLSDEELRSGMAEAIKHGIIGDEELFEEFSRDVVDRSFWTTEQAGERIARVVQVKRTVIEEDPFETGRRAVLNLGHTVGHALERLSGYALRHGEAVSIGMIAAARLAWHCGLATEGLGRQIEKTLERHGLPIECPPYAVADIVAAMGHDKKRQDGKLRWVLPRAIGDVVVRDDVPSDLVQDMLIEMGARRA